MCVDQITVETYVSRDVRVPIWQGSDWDMGIYRVWIMLWVL